MESGRPGALVVEMVMPFAWAGAGGGGSPLWRGKESISSEWEESIFLETVSGGVGEEKGSFVVVVGWEICAAEEEEGEVAAEGLEKETFAFWQEGRGTSPPSTTFSHW